MKVIEHEIVSLKNSVSEMWSLVHQQIYNAGEAMLTGDKELAYKVISRERRVNAFELKIDSDCEDIIALYAPVAIDLRFVLAMYKINTNLERLGDFAESIARFTCNLPESEPIDPQLIKETRVQEMLDQLLEMISLAQEAFDKESSEIASRIFIKDNLIDEINHHSTTTIAKYIEQHPGSALAGLYMAGVIRKMERFGDHCTNIAEELIFYLDAKVMKHMGKTEKETEK
ncbi:MULTISPECIES: phosphate signaling complex protein PhoU [Parabacteroides]|uniref:Phosphate-specific transport system accessory protein PhoU n=1 Tax=Parabacteroides chinchillae TaxID=871327 RepID=A0A8G2BXT2_9BACT|nr:MULTISPECIES: phosphate signaling complex protein PhoU [Parabacteroides]SEG09125.1 phosphate transport system protein [Parabacteroides chinchillae]